MSRKKIIMQRIWRQPTTLIVGALVLLGALILIAWLRSVHRGALTFETTVTQAQRATQAGNYTAAYDQLKTLKNGVLSKPELIKLYSELAAAAANVGQLREAIGYLQTKHQVDPSTHPADAYMLAVLYERTDQMPEALAEYKIALTYYQSLPKSPDADAQIQGLKAIIARLEAAQ